MRKILTVFTLMIAGVFAFTACSDDNSPGNQPDGTPLNPTDVPAAVLNAFEKQYPDANNVQWTKKDNYAVATFTKSGDTSGQQSAWFAWDNGIWGMTEYEIPYSLLPDDVRTAFEASEYAASPWRYDREIDVLQRNETETLYVIEVEKNEAGTETEVDLYYTADGLLVKEIIDAERDKDSGPCEPAGRIPKGVCSASHMEQRIPDGSPLIPLLRRFLENGGVLIGSGEIILEAETAALFQVRRTDEFSQGFFVLNPQYAAKAPFGMGEIPFKSRFLKFRCEGQGDLIAESCPTVYGLRTWHLRRRIRFRMDGLLRCGSFFGIPEIQYAAIQASAGRDCAALCAGNDSQFRCPGFRGVFPDAQYGFGLCQLFPFFSGEGF